jgi:hypothetical protein
MTDHDQRFKNLLTEKYKGVREMVTTTFEKGLEQGRQQGYREMLRDLLETRFGPLSEQAQQRLTSWPPERLRELGRALLAAKSLQELGLED